MKHAIIGVATGACLLLAATPAVAAAPKDPLTALRAQLVMGKGVSFTFRTYGESSLLSQTGRLQFGMKGITASDVTGKLNIKDDKPVEDFGSPDDEGSPAAGMKAPERTIRIGRTSYVKGGPMSPGFPEGKTWWKQSPGWTSGVTAMFGGFVNAADPSTLKVLLARSKRSGSTYKGSMSVKDLLKASDWSRATMWWKLDASVKVNWTLAVGSSGLPVKLTTRLENAKAGVSKTAMEMRYTGWGAKVAIKAPPASAVTTTLSDTAPLQLPPGPKR